MSNRYTLKVQRIEEFYVEVEANSLEDAKFFVEMQSGPTILYRDPAGTHGVIATVWGPEKPMKYRVSGTGTWPKDGK